VYLVNRGYLMAKCGAANDAVVALLACTAEMAVATLHAAGDGLCALRFEPTVADVRVRPMQGFPCGVFAYEGTGPDPETAGAPRRVLAGRRGRRWRQGRRWAQS
jgi:hypothetical protein